MTSDPLHPLSEWIGKRLPEPLKSLYFSHTAMANLAIVESVSLLISNGFIYSFSSVGFVTIGLVAMNLLVATPITFLFKYLSQKHWVWRR